MVEREKELDSAHQYNHGLEAGAAFDPFTQGLAGTDSQPYQDYVSQLQGLPTGVMGRVIIPDIKVDMPIYHGTSEETLMKGVGHLYGTALPVGGQSTHSVLTAHSGLAEHRMLVTGQRIDLLDEEVLQNPLEPVIPGFPWWLAILGGAIVAAGIYLWRSNRGGTQEQQNSTAETSSVTASLP